MNVNTPSVNVDLPLLTAKITTWHHERNLIDGATAWSQTGKLLEEFTELVAAQMPEAEPLEIVEAIGALLGELYAKDRIKKVNILDAENAFNDALGDMYVVQVNLAERENITMQNCVDMAFSEIEHRKGEMRDGVFIKEEDL